MSKAPNEQHPKEDAELERIGYGLNRLTQGIRGLIGREAHQAGLSPTQALTLLALADSEEPLTTSALAARFGMSRPTISEVLGSLEHRHLIRREFAPEDRRRIAITLTSQGHEVVSRLSGGSDAPLSRALRRLPREDRGIFYRSLVSLLASMEGAGVLSARTCASCHYFQAGRPEQGRPHFCACTEALLADADLRIDCPDFLSCPETNPSGDKPPALSS